MGQGGGGKGARRKEEGDAWADRERNSIYACVLHSQSWSRRQS